MYDENKRMLPALYQNHALSDDVYWLSQIPDQVLGIRLSTTGGGERSCFMEANAALQSITQTRVCSGNANLEAQQLLLPSLSGCFGVHSRFTEAMLASFKADLLCLSPLQHMKDMTVRGTQHWIH